MPFESQRYLEFGFESLFSYESLSLIGTLDGQLFLKNVEEVCYILYSYIHGHNFKSLRRGKDFLSHNVLPYIALLLLILMLIF